ARAETTSTEASQDNSVADMSSNVAEVPSPDTEMSPDVVLNGAEILPTLEKVASLKNGDELDLKISSRMALHLINLTEKSLLALDDCLTSPDIRTADKIKAAELVGQWAGLKDGKVLKQVLSKFDLVSEGVNTQKATTTLVPQSLAEAKKVEEEITRRYTNEIYGEFVENDYYFPVAFEEKYFDIELFLELLEYQDMQDDSQGYNFREKGIAVLRDRGMSDELRELGYEV
ncbi:MAG: hypothetical protein AAF630_06865, partial [Cyanobacteria bacterium P01_C01_bin.38]